MRNFLLLSLSFQTLLFRNYYPLFFLSMQFSIFHFCFLLLSQSLLHCSIFFNFSFFLKTYLATSSSCLSSFSDPFLLQIIPSGFEDSTRMKIFLPFLPFFLLLNQRIFPLKLHQEVHIKLNHTWENNWNSLFEKKYILKIFGLKFR